MYLTPKHIFCTMHQDLHRFCRPWMHAPFCWLTMVPRASIVTIYIHTHCLHLLLDLRLQSKRICIGIRYKTQLQVYMLHLHVHNVLSLYSILIPPPTVFVGISPKHRDPTSFTSSSAEICQLKTSHATTLRARPKLHRRMTCLLSTQGQLLSTRAA